jgi:hypothetical protein
MPVAEVTLVIDIVEAGGRWLVRLAENGYAEHANQEEARRAAFDLAAEARQFGRDVEVWDRLTGERLL